MEWALVRQRVGEILAWHLFIAKWIQWWKELKCVLTGASLAAVAAHVAAYVCLSGSCLTVTFVQNSNLLHKRP